MSQHLQPIIDEQVRKINELLRTGVPAGHRIITHFQDFYRLVDDGDFEMTASQASQILDLVDLLKQHGQMGDYYERAALGVIVQSLDFTEDQNATVLDRLFLDAIAVSLRNIEAKEEFSVPGGRDLFLLFSSHSHFLSDEAFAAVLNHSPALTRYAGGQNDQNNLLFGCTNSYFQQECPTNYALLHLVEHHTERFEESIDWWKDYGYAGKYVKRLGELQDVIARVDDLGIKITLHHADALFITGLSERLLSIRFKGGLPEYEDALIGTVASLMRITTPVRGAQPLSDNLFRFHGRPYTNSFKEKTTWLNKGFCEEFHQDLLDNLASLDPKSLPQAVREAFDLFARNILLNAAQAKAGLMKQSDFDNTSFIQSMIGYCKATLEGENPLAGLMKADRLAILEAVDDKELKRDLLKKYKSDKGQVLMHDLGM